MSVTQAYRVRYHIETAANVGRLFSIRLLIIYADLPDMRLSACLASVPRSARILCIAIISNNQARDWESYYETIALRRHRFIGSEYVKHLRFKPYRVAEGYITIT